MYSIRVSWRRVLRIALEFAEFLAKGFVVFLRDKFFENVDGGGLVSGGVFGSCQQVARDRRRVLCGGGDAGASQGEVGIAHAAIVQKAVDHTK